MLSNYRREYLAFNNALHRENYLYFSGQKSSYRLAEIYDRYSDLFTKDAITSLEKERDEIKEYYQADRRGLEHLITFATENYLKQSVKFLTQEIANSEYQTRIEWDGELYPFRKILLLIANETDRSRREKLYSKYLSEIAATNDLRGERWEKLHEQATLLGYENYLAMLSQRQRIDYAKLDRMMQQFLNDTEKIYNINMDRLLLQDFNIAKGSAKRVDGIFFTRLQKLDNRYPRRLLLTSYQETMNALGIKPGKQKNIQLDLELRSNKAALPFCAPIDIPNDIRLVLNPVGGVIDYRALFHETGHAQFYGYTAADLKPEFKYNGDLAMRESFALLLQSLLANAIWLEEIFDDRETEQQRASLMLVWLYLIRRNAARLHYEIDFHTCHRANSGDYAETLTQATRLQFDVNEYLFDIDETMTPAHYLRAWLFQILLSDYLKTRYGRRWWHQRRAGELLKEIWNTGHRYTVEELSEQLGLGELIIEPLESEFFAVLKA